MKKEKRKKLLIWQHYSDKLTAIVLNGEAKGTKKKRRYLYEFPVHALYAPFIVFDIMVLSEGYPSKCLTNGNEELDKSFETISCRSKNPNWPRIQSLVAP